MQHNTIPYSICEIDSRGILSMLTEKPEQNFLVNTGMYLLNPDALNFIPDNDFFHITQLINKRQKSDFKIGVYPVSEKAWVDVGQWGEFQRITKIFQHIMINKYLQVRLYSDSLGLPRGEEILNHQRYISILKKYFEDSGYIVDLIDRARANYNINDLYQWFTEDNKYFGSNADITIIQEGIVDCAPRPIPKKIRNIVSKMPNCIRKSVINFLHNNRSQIQNLGIRYYYITPQVYYDKYMKFVKEASDNSKRVYLFNILPTTDDIEKHSPGLSKSIENYNKIIFNIIKNLNRANVYLIDVYSYVKGNEDNIIKYINQKDGHHITVAGNKFFADLLIQEHIRSGK